MRFVFDVETPCTVSGGGRPYALGVQQKKANGARLSLTFETEKRGFMASESVDLEGDAAYLWAAFVDAAAVVETAMESMVEDGHVSADWKVKVRRTD